MHRKQTLPIQHLLASSCAGKSDFAGQTVSYLSHKRGPQGVVVPAVPAGTEGDTAPVAHKAAEGGRCS